MFHELTCSSVIEFLWFQYITNTQPINHLGVWQTNHLLMEWGRREFLTAFVLFIKPDQTMKIQTSLKGKVRELHGITYSSAADGRRLLMEGESKTKHRKGEEGVGSEPHSGRVKE